MRSLSLTKEFVRSEFKLKYQGTYLGYLWSFIKPLLFFAVLFLATSVFLRFDREDYALHLFLGIIIWNFFAEATTRSMYTVLEKGNLIKKIYFPRILIVVSATLLAFITFLLNLAVFSIFYIFTKGTLNWTMFFFLFFAVFLYIITFGIALFLAAFYTKFRDLLPIWEVLLQLGFWLTPIVYPLSLIPEVYSKIVLWNPLALIVHNSGLVMIQHQIPALTDILSIALTATGLLILGSIIFFKRVSFFAEEL